MGVLIAKKSFVQEREDDLKVLLNDLQESVDFVNDSPAEAAKVIVEKGFIGDEEIAEAAIPGCHITLYTGKTSQTGMEMLKGAGNTDILVKDARDTEPVSKQVSVSGFDV